MLKCEYVCVYLGWGCLYGSTCMCQKPGQTRQDLQRQVHEGNKKDYSYLDSYEACAVRSKSVEVHCSLLDLHYIYIA